MGAHLRTDDVLVRQHVEVVVVHLPRDALGLSEASPLHQPDRGFRHVMAHDQDDQGRKRAQSERHAPDGLVIEVENEEDRDHRKGRTSPIANMNCQRLPMTSRSPLAMDSMM